MADKGMAAEPAGLDDLLKQKAKELVVALEAGELPRATELINQLQMARHELFYNEVGYLTRGLHEAIKSFSTDVGGQLSSSDDPEGAAMTDASERLAYVIRLTEDTAHETMDRVDKALVLADRLDAQSGRFRDLLLLVGQLEGEHQALDGVYDRTCALKDENEGTLAELRTELTDILVSQSYQDITGQLIRRVITLLTQVEGQLVSLMNMAAKVEQLGGIESAKVNAGAGARGKTGSAGDVQAAGPEFRQDASSTACDQDEVDELLSNLGF